jgi:hypothetical protein
MVEETAQQISDFLLEFFSVSRKLQTGARAQVSKKSIIRDNDRPLAYSYAMHPRGLKFVGMFAKSI